MTSNVACYFASSYLTCREHGAREREDVSRRTDFLTDYTMVTYMIKYRNEKGEAR